MSVPSDQPSWLRGLVDRPIGAAMQLMHDDPGSPWSVGKLAAGVGMSRSSFAARFARVVGESPMQYLARWRLRRAAAMLRNTGLSVDAVAARSGYASAAAFSKAFARTTGVAPGAYRRTAAAPAAAAFAAGLGPG